MERRRSSVQNPAQLQLHRAGFEPRTITFSCLLNLTQNLLPSGGLTLAGLTEFRCNAFQRVFSREKFGLTFYNYHSYFRL